ncbi:MaoC/PaaZ C-terminal domain-containing protein [Streptomyces sp. NPDC005803]|uniref:MaoC/PaaZ C-terminal domain-containing protein n=1 Tax=Streptomyces sp. NPDC005803 TaxID=3154297 RepID=UPI0033C15288
MTLTDITLKAGESRETVLVEDLTRTRLVQYAGASGDYNPLHTDERFAREIAGYSGVFAHGMLTMGMTGRALTEWVGEERLLSYGVRFTAQVWPGDTLTAEITVTSVEEGVAQLSIVTRNQGGATVVSGTATAKVD